MLQETTTFNCEQNLVSTLEMQMMDSNPNRRPDFKFCLDWLSHRNTDTFQHFVTRVFDKLNNPLMYKKARAICEVFQEEVCSTGWLNPEILDDDVYKLIIEHEFNFNPKRKIARGKNDRKSFEDLDDVVIDQIKADLHGNDLYGLLSQIRNTAAHTFRSKATTTYIGHLSASFINFWRKKFPLLVTATLLIALNLDLHRDRNFHEFLNGGPETFEFFKNKSCRGNPIIIKWP